MNEREKLHARLDQRFEYIKQLFERMHGMIDLGELDGTEPGREWLEQWCVGRGVQLCPGDFSIGDSIGIDMDQKKLALDYWGYVDFFPGESCSLDYVVTNYLEVHPDTNAILAEYASALKKGGKFAVVCRDADSYENGVGPLKNNRRAHCFSLKTLTCYLARAGLKVKEFERVGQELRVMATKA